MESPSPSSAVFSDTSQPRKRGDTLRVDNGEDIDMPLNIATKEDDRKSNNCETKEPEFEIKDLKVHHSSNYIQQEDNKGQEIEALNKAFDRSQEESQDMLQISIRMEEERKRELEDAARKLKLKMFKQQRCYICTLTFPCSHFKSIDEAYSKNGLKKDGDMKFSKQVSEIIEKSREESLKTLSKSKSSQFKSPTRETPKQKQSNFLKKGDGILPGLGTLADPEKDQKIRENKMLHQKLMQEYETYTGPKTVRIQIAPGKYEVKTLQNGLTLAEESEEEKRKKQQKEDRERSIQLAKLMKYKEQKLQQDQQMLELEKK